MGLNRHSPQSEISTDVSSWRRKTLDLLYIVAVICASVEIYFLFSFVNNKPDFSDNFVPYLVFYVLVLVLAFVKILPVSIRANGLAFITFVYGFLELFTTGLTGDGRIFLLAAPVIALLLSGTLACEILTILSLLVFAMASIAPTVDFLPLQFIPQEEIITETTWISSGIIFGTILIGLVIVVWQFARINASTSRQNNRLASEGKVLRDMTRKLQLREAEMQALLNAIGDKVMVIDREGRIIHTADASIPASVNLADGHSKNILRLLPKPQAVDILGQIQDVLFSNQTRVIDYSVNENGKERWYSGTISPYEEDKVVMVCRDITENIHSNSREREQRTLANAIKDAASLVNSQLEINEILTRLLAAVEEVVPCDSAAIILLGERGKLSCYGRSHLPDFDQKYERMNLKNVNDIQTLRTIKRTGQPLFIPDVRHYPAWMDLIDENPTRSFLGCPIKIKGKVAGFLTLDSIQPGYYNQEHVNRLQSFMDLTGTAIENANLQQVTQKMAISDELTGLFNRRGLMDLGRREIDRAKRFHHPLVLAIIDLDNFKSINDTYGHIAGDQLLNQVADCCRASFREIDIISRYGGDEIVILLIENDASQAYQIADRFRESIAGRVFRTDSGNLTTTLSIGLAELSPEMDNITQLIDQADRALYLAKEGGRNRIMAV